MEIPDDGFPGKSLTRRQFGVLVGGGAFLLVGGAMYGVIRTTENSGAAAAIITPFGRIILRRAGRFARLDQQGRTASSNLTMAASRFNSTSSSGAHRAGTTHRAVAQTPSVFSASGSHNHGGSIGNGNRPQPVNSTWGDVIVLELELQNEGAAPALFSPGQLRLKLGRTEVTVTPQDADRAPGHLAASANEHMLISYLAPSLSADFELEFRDEHTGKPRRLPLALPAATEVLS